jgi:hypothetical protein
MTRFIDDPLQAVMTAPVFTVLPGRKPRRSILVIDDSDEPGGACAALPKLRRSWPTAAPFSAAHQLPRMAFGFDSNPVARTAATPGQSSFRRTEVSADVVSRAKDADV